MEIYIYIYIYLLQVPRRPWIAYRRIESEISFQDLQSFPNVPTHAQYAPAQPALPTNDNDEQSVNEIEVKSNYLILYNIYLIIPSISFQCRFRII